MNKTMTTDDRFSRFLAEGNILCGSKSRTAEEVIRELSELIAHNMAGYDGKKIFDDVMLREKVLPTVISPGLAVPHARTAINSSPVIAMAISKDGFDFKEDSETPVKVVILMLTPPDNPDLHLQLLSALAKDFAVSGVIETLTTLKNPQEVMQYFHSNSSAIPQFLRAKDVMNTQPVTLLENNTLREAIEKLSVYHLEEIPVIDNDQELRGILSLSDLFKFSLPEHILWLDDLSSVYRFQPFSEVLQSADDTKVADIMREEFISVEEEIPAVQLAKIFLQNNLSKLMVVNSQGKFSGIVDIRDFSARLFWE